ncbi:hypothetical protein Tcan_11863 [Toxocara canis]|uniref:Uncharacterized protein n=1 Tax=Toxocara canis TaxID=6265 RepID=A0A0B2VQW9_TOXCA|nr:hypothetical protein Tcan_11863 [Toxocara canis]
MSFPFFSAMNSYLLSLMFFVSIVGVLSATNKSHQLSKTHTQKALFVDTDEFHASRLRFKRSGTRVSSRQTVALSTNKAIVYVAITTVTILLTVTAFVRLIWALCNRRKNYNEKAETSCSSPKSSVTSPSVAISCE